MIPCLAYDPSVTRAAETARADPADAAAFAAARAACRRDARDFFLPTAFLSRPKRDAACAVVAFCRMVREAMEAPHESLEGAGGLRHHPVAAAGFSGMAPGPPAAAGGLSSPVSCTTCGPTTSLDARVALLRERLDEIYAGTLQLPAPESRSEPQHVLHAFALAVARHQIPRQYFLDLAEGLQRDRCVARYATWAALDRHCRQTAGAVALALAAVFGVTHSGAGECAVKLATGMRLTAILCDLKEDWARGKLYLPLEDLARFRYSERDLAGAVVNDRFRDLMRFEIARARGLFHEGAEGLCWLADDGSRLTVSALAAISSGVLGAIERQGLDVFSRRPNLTTGQKLRRLPLAWSLSRRGPGERLHDLFRRGRLGPR